MKSTYFHAAGALALTFAIAACIPQAAPPPPAPPPPVAAPAPAPPPPPLGPSLPVIDEPVFDSYLDAPQTPGAWFYISEPGETLAIFASNPSEDAKLILRCAQGSVGLVRITTNDSSRPRRITVTTETAERDLLASPLRGRDRMVGLELPASDPLLDAMAITKGRFAVSVEGERTLYLPAWVEVSRVIEDCR